MLFLVTLFFNLSMASASPKTPLSPLRDGMSGGGSTEESEIIALGATTPGSQASISMVGPSDSDVSGAEMSVLNELIRSLEESEASRAYTPLNPVKGDTPQPKAKAKAMPKSAVNPLFSQTFVPFTINPQDQKDNDDDNESVKSLVPNRKQEEAVLPSIIEVSLPAIKEEVDEGLGNVEEDIAELNSLESSGVSRRKALGTTADEDEQAILIKKKVKKIAYEIFGEEDVQILYPISQKIEEIMTLEVILKKKQNNSKIFLIFDRKTNKVIGITEISKGYQGKLDLSQDFHNQNENTSDVKPKTNKKATKAKKNDPKKNSSKDKSDSKK